MRIIIVNYDAILDSEMLKLLYEHLEFSNVWHYWNLQATSLRIILKYLHDNSYKLFKLCEEFLNKNNFSHQGGPNVFSSH